MKMMSSFVPNGCVDTKSNIILYNVIYPHVFISEMYQINIIENTIAHTILNMKKDRYLYKKVCPTPNMKRIKGTNMHTGDYETDDSDSTLLETESEKEDIPLAQLQEENILSKEEEKGT